MATPSLVKSKFVSAEERRNIFKKLKHDPENRICFDCPQRNPTWASSTFGVYICLDCAGGQRRLGTHVSFVRSVDMDEWTPEQLESMKLGGNKKARLYFREHGVNDLHQRQDTKYNSSTARHYKSQLQRSVTQSLATLNKETKNVTTNVKIDIDKEKKTDCGLDRLASEFSDKKNDIIEKTEMGSRALSAPELSRVSDKTTTPQKPHSPLSEVYSPVKEELKNASVSFANGASQEKKKSGALLAAPTLSAGAMLGGGNSGTSTTRNSSSARRALARKPRGLGARRLDGDVIMTQDPPPRSATPPTPPPANSRLAALNAEINAPSPPPTNVPTAPSPVITNRQSNREPIAINQQQEQSSITARFADKKGFGSDAFFDREDSPPSNNDGRPSASRFAGQSGIGSDAFFDDQKSGVDVTTQLKGVLSSTLDRFVR